MRIFTLLILLSLPVLSQAQEEDAPYLKNPVLPQFSILNSDSTSWYTSRDIRKGMPVMIMLFSPDCEHCIKQMNEMIKRMKDLKKLQIIMVTYQPMDLLVDFIKTYNLKKYSNIKAGRDTKFLLPGFYQIKSLPYFALYDKEGKLITTFESNTKVDTLLKAFAKK